MLLDVVRLQLQKVLSKSLLYIFGSMTVAQLFCRVQIYREWFA
ncbi:hypothetical protein CLV88_12052 [Shimia abyssi]|uniref:Uncharacterized protein n=1 Tax=Shimia abyssi TaxID=1662395 RepID=A0A2P8F655_9RHOB|nr:hypothetical protein CLV88_12052 [Shimia abyssi]